MSSRAKTKSIKKRVLRRLMLTVGPFLGWAITYFIGRTSRWKIINAEKQLAMFHRGDPYIVAFWHSRTLLLPFVFMIEGGKNVIAMVSSSDDGVFTSRILRHFGIRCAPGSSTRGGKQALAEMLKSHKREHTALAITPDGPRGPAEVCKPGAILLSRETGLPIFVLTFHAKKVTRFKSWDRFVLVWPFNEIYVTCGEAIVAPPDANEAQMESCRQTLENEMRRLTRFTEDLAEGKDVGAYSYFWSRVSWLTNKTVWTKADGSPFSEKEMLRKYYPRDFEDQPVPPQSSPGD